MAPGRLTIRLFLRLMFLRKMVNLMMKKIITLALASIICTEVVYPMQQGVPVQQVMDRSFTQVVKDNQKTAGYMLAALCCACAGLAYNLSMQIPEQKSICNMCATATACCAIVASCCANKCLKNKKA